MPEMCQGTVVLTERPHFPTMYTRETVKHLAAFGLDSNQMAVVMKCSLQELERYYSDDIATGLVRVNAQVQAAVLHAAIYDRNVQAQKLWLVNKAGWRSGDAPRITVNSGAQGNEQVTHQRRAVIVDILREAIRNKRATEQVIDARVVSTTKAQGSNGAGFNGSNGSKHK